MIVSYEVESFGHYLAMCIAFEGKLDRKGWTKAKLAKSLGVDPCTVTNWVRDRNKPSQPRIIQICGLLHVMDEATAIALLGQ